MSARKDYMIGFGRPPAAHRFKRDNRAIRADDRRAGRTSAPCCRRSSTAKCQSRARRADQHGGSGAAEALLAAVSGDAKMLGMVIALMESHLGVIPGCQL